MFLKPKLKLLLAALLISAALISCKKDEAPQQSQSYIEKEYIYDVMTDIYYWYKDVPKNVNFSGSQDNFQFFESLLVQKDRWSWMMTGEEFTEMETGVYESYGMSLDQPVDYYQDYSIKVRYVHPNSPMSEKGVKRGWTLTHLNGVTVETLINNNTINQVLSQRTNSFTFRDLNNTPQTFNATARVINTRSSLITTVFTQADFPNLPYPVGYFNYLTFNENLQSDITNAMSTLKAANIEALILDLRYNGGGDGDVMHSLANFIAPASAEGELFSKKRHNDRYSSWDNDPKTIMYIKRTAQSLNLKKLIVLTTDATASASEGIINGLNPLMQVIQIGRTTYGKPNGMYVIPYPQDDYDSPDFVMLPISFYTVNKIGFGEFENGLIPTNSRPDDLYHDFGVTEDYIKAALTYLATGQFPPLPAAAPFAVKSSTGKQFQTKEMSKGYGYLFDKPKNR